MDNSKIQIKIGAIEFSAEGKSAWLSGELDKVLSKAHELMSVAPVAGSDHSPAAHSDGPGKKVTNLALFLKDKGASVSQTKKFLATAAFNQLNGMNRQNTVDVTRALKAANQNRLGNPSDCLNQNVGKGLCEKDGKSFFVTVPGLEELGIKN